MCKLLFNLSVYLLSKDDLGIICSATAQYFIKYEVIHYLLEVSVTMSLHNNLSIAIMNLSLWYAPEMRERMLRRRESEAQGYLGPV